MDDINIANLLADQLENLFSTHVNTAYLTDIEDGVWPTDLWQQIEEMGVADAMTVSEDFPGLGWEGASALFRAQGRHAAPVPLAETMLARYLLSESGLTVPPQVALPVEGDFVVSPEGDISGSAELVCWAQHANCFVLIGKMGEQHVLCQVAKESEGISLEPLAGYSRIPSAKVVFDKACAEQICEAKFEDAEWYMQASLALLKSLLINGSCNKIIELAVEYVTTRKQFGKPIAKFQAIQHLLAESACRAAALEMAANYACLEADGALLRVAAIAKYSAGAAALEIPQKVHQAFGAIGITEEHELQFFSRRLWQWRFESGSQRYWAKVLGEATLQAGPEELWPGLTQ